MAWVDMWAGVWSANWGVDNPGEVIVGDYYNTQVEIYADTAFGTLTDIINSRIDPTVLTELKGHGAGSFKVSKRDPKILANPALLSYRNYVKVRLNGSVIGGFIIQTKKTTIVGAGEEADEMWHISGEGPRSWSRDASVYPAGGLKTNSAETRFFNFATEQGSWYNPANWNFAAMRWAWNNTVNGAPKGHAPANWPDAAGARWIWNTPTDLDGDSDDPEGYCYFRHEFTVTGTPGVAVSYAFFIAADDSAEVFVDGEQKAVIEAPGWHETTRVELELLPGPHVIGVKAYNAKSDTPGEILTSLFTYGDPASPTAAVLKNHSGMADTWKVFAYPTVEPGWSIGDVLLTLLNEAKARGVRFANNFIPTFSALTDSSGLPWGDSVSWSFGVGSTYESVFEAVEELGCDIYIDPDTLNMYVWKKRGSDRSHTGLTSTWDTIATNLATHGNFEIAGSAVEARRNYVPTPNLINTVANWNVTATISTATPTSYGAQVDVISASATSAPLFFLAANVSSVENDRWSGAMEVTNPTAFPMASVRLQVYSYGQNAAIADGGVFNIAPGETKIIQTVSTLAASAATTGVRLILYGNGTVPGARLIVTSATLEKVVAPGTIFSGAEPVKLRRNLSVNPYGINSGTNWSSNDQPKYPVTRGVTPPVPHPLGIPTAVESYNNGTVSNSVLASIYNPDGLGSTGAPQRTYGVWVLVTEPDYKMAAGANGLTWPADELPVNTWTYVRSTNAVPAHAFGTVYVSKITGNASTTARAYLTGLVTESGPALVPEVYYDGSTSIVGRAFAWVGTPGASPSYEYDQDITTSWQGTANASASIATGTGISTYATSPVVARALRSSRFKNSGSYSLRQIPSYFGRGSGYTDIANHTTPRGLERGKTYTLVTWFNQETIQGFTNANARAVLLTGTTGGYNVTVQASNTTGPQLVNLVFTVPPTGDYYLRLYNGGQAGDPDSYWDDLTIIEGAYDGPTFNGSTVSPDPASQRYSWTSTVNASTSIMELASITGNPVIFAPGKNLVSADETGQAEIANTLMIRTSEGWAEEAPEDTTSLTQFGRVETQMTTELTSTGVAPLIAELFSQKALPEVSATFEIVPITGTIPFQDFNVGDYVSAPGEVPGVKEKRRVMSISFAEDKETGLPRYALEFDTIFKDRQSELERWISRLANSSAIGGGFSNSGNLPSTVVVSPPGTPAAPIPDVPTGLVVTSDGKFTEDGGSTSEFNLTWNPVITGLGFGSVEVDNYEIWGRRSTETEPALLAIVFDSFAVVRGFDPGDSWLFKVRAVSLRGGPGNFTAETAITAEAPQVPLGKPSTPTLTSSFGGVTVKWDGLLGGLPAPSYIRYVRVERSPSGANTWTSVGVLTNFAMNDLPGNAGTSYDYRLVAVDTYGNTSVPSDVATIAVKGINSGDISGGLASNNLVANGSFENGMAPAWVITASTPGSSATVLTTGGMSGASYLRMIRVSETPVQGAELAVGQASDFYIPVSSVGQYGYFVSAKAASVASTAPNSFTVRAYWYQGDKTTPASTAFSTAVDTGDLTSSAAYFAGRVYPPADARFMRIVLVNAVAATTIYVDDVVAREAITPNMIGQNVLLAEHFSAGSVTTNALQAGSVTTDILDAGSVRADKIGAGQIQTNHLASEVGASLDISSNSSVNILINRTDQLSDDLSNTDAAVKDLTTYYSFGPDGAIIGQTDSAFKLYLKNDRIEILENGVVVSYWDSGRMVVPSFVGEEVILGNHKLEKYTVGTVVRAI